MQYCHKCKIAVRGNNTKCPLCQGKLSGEPENPAFPKIKKNKITMFSMARMITFICIVIEIVLGTVEYLATSQQDIHFRWIIFVMVGIFIGWIDFIFGVYIRYNIIKTLTVQVYFAMLINIYIDYATGFHRWSVNWMIPISFVALLVITYIFAKVLHFGVEDYVLYLLADTVLCFFQIIALFTGLINFQYPAVVCIAIFLVVAAATLIFKFNELKRASVKWFNI